MTLRHFRIFHALSQDLHMTRTAERLFMTQPSVSQAMAELESHYGVALLQRLGKKLYLTPAGSELLARVSGILAQIDATEAAFAQKSKRRVVRLGASATVGSFVLPALLRSLAQRFPEVEVEFQVGNTAQMESALLQAQLDLAIVEGRTRSPLLHLIDLFSDPLVLVGHPRMVPRQRHLRPRDLEGLPFLQREAGSGSAEQAREAFASWKLEPRITGTVNSIDALHRLVREGLGLAFLPRVAVAKDLEEGELAEVALPGARRDRDISLAYHGARNLEGDLAPMVSYMQELYKAKP